MSHTPGPWHCHFAAAVAEQSDGEWQDATGITTADEKSFSADGNRGDLVAFVPHDRDHEANARLIASAPELLAALKEMRREYGTFYRGNCYITVSYEAKLGWANRVADAAIAKAEGKV